MRTKLSRTKARNIPNLPKINIRKTISRSISAKIFVITSLVLILFLTIMYVTIVRGYDSYYKHKKVNTYANYITTFGREFNEFELDGERAQYITTFENTYAVKVVIFDKDMNVEFDGNQKYTTKVNALESNIPSNDVKLAAVLYDYNGYEKIEYQNQTIIGSGIITKIDRYLPPYNEGAIYGICKNKYFSHENAYPQYYYIFILSPLQPIDDAVVGIKTFFIYFYIASIFVVFIVSLILSNIITKPLKAINNVAVKMSSFDFSEKCSDKYKDEIGSLAKSLNLLSSNLQRSLKRLREINKKLEDDIEKERNIEKIRKEFVAAVSHDLKTPVSVIQGYAEGIKDGIFEEDEQEHYLDVIIDETNKMNSLIKDMLDLSALEGGNIAIKKEKYNFSEQLNSVIRNLSSIAKEKGMKIVTNSFKDEFINADYNRIEQVLNNLITNAIKYGYENTDINIFLLRSKDEYIKLEIENKGELISKEDFEKIWTRFYKIDKSRNRNAGGTGLGLAISKNIIQLHNGEIGGYNKENSIVFYFKLKKE